MGTRCVSAVSSETASWGCGATAYVLAIRYGSCRFLDGCQGIGILTVVLWSLPPEAQLRSSSLKMRLQHDVGVRCRPPPRGGLWQPGVPRLLVGSLRGQCVVLGEGLRDLWVVCHLQVALSWFIATGPLPLPVRGASIGALCRRLTGASHAFMATAVIARGCCLGQATAVAAHA